MTEARQLILASASPRRSEILRGLGLGFEIEPADIDESRLSDEAAEIYVERIARSKADNRRRPGTLTIAADTIVVIDDSVLGKPESPEDAKRMLARLAGREHEVLTAVAVLDANSGALRSSVERSKVRIAAMSLSEINWYVATGEPLDKAGAYAIQGLGSLFVERVEGNYANIVGLPVPTLYRLVAELGQSLLDFRVESADEAAAS
ncbi:MAG: septum formation inhibitor Maf [Acidobacteria bacterium]|nr:septum formation inhibitor Maf [Acidobacteriota bacterium]